MIHFDQHTLESLRNIEQGARACLFFAHNHHDDVLDLVPGEMNIHFGKPAEGAMISHGVTCEVFTLKLEDGFLPFHFEVRMLVGEEGHRYWLACANGWVFACRAEALMGRFEENAFEIYVGGPVSFADSFESEWTPFDGGCPLTNTEDWDDLLRKAILHASFVQKKFIDRCEKQLAFEALGDRVEISQEVISLISDVRRRASS